MKSRGTTWDWINYLPHSLEVFKGNQPVIIEVLFSVIFFLRCFHQMHLSLYNLKDGLLSSLNYSFLIFEMYNTLKFHSCQIFLKNIF